MTITSLPFKRLVTALKHARKTCTVVEQCCGGLISTSIMAQPGASSVFYGGSVAYNTRMGQKLLLNDASLHQALTNIPNGNDAETYIKSKLEWTARSSKAFCEALGTDYAIAEGGAAGPTFRPSDMTTGFTVISVAGKDAQGHVSVLCQEVIHSPHANREANMRLFSDAAANLATQVVSGLSIPKNSIDAQELAKALRLDRATHLRSDPLALAALKSTAKYVVLNGTVILVNSISELALLSHDQAQSIPGEKRETFLGILSDTGTAVFGIDLLDTNMESTVPLVEGTSFVDTRTSAPLFSSIENELALHATALAQWQRRTSFCNLCGGKTTFVDGGTCCRCTACKTPSWPRQDPSMIAVISSRDGQRVLLAHSSRHPPRFNTVLAGFVEAGETFEAAVARETFEETGIRIDEGSVQYVGSQPWPFPQSCMIGFTAYADCSQELKVDTKELISAGWFSKADVARAAEVEGPTMKREIAEEALRKDPTLPLLIPPKGVIARKLLDKWLAS
jgi:NAD+ diphosphatase